MGIWNFFSERRTRQLVEQIGREVAQQSREPVLQRVRRRAATMRIAEARGYVRSRALEIVHRELAAVHNGRITVDPTTQTLMISLATEAVVTRIMAELRSVPKGVKPGRRQAA